MNATSSTAHPFITQTSRTDCLHRTRQNQDTITHTTIPDDNPTTMTSTHTTVPDDNPNTMTITHTTISDQMTTLLQ